MIRVDSQPLYDALCPEWKLAPAPEPEERLSIVPLSSPVTAPGEPITFGVSLLRHGKPVSGIGLKCRMEREFHDPVEFPLPTRSAPVEVTTDLERPGFVRLEVKFGELTAPPGGGGGGRLTRPHVEHPFDGTAGELSGTEHLPEGVALQIVAETQRGEVLPLVGGVPQMIDHQNIVDSGPVESPDQRAPDQAGAAGDNEHVSEPPMLPQRPRRTHLPVGGV